jgi:dTMP kinase
MFITFEGIEGSGKGVAIQLSADWLKREGRNVLVTREPGGGSIGPGIRSMLLDAKNTHINALAELFLYLADRAQHVNEVIVPALQSGQVVISDRFADSTIVYQGYGRGLPVHTLYTLNHIAVNGVWPDLTIVLDLPVEIGLERARKRNEELAIEEAEGRFEAESLDFHNKIRDGYLVWAEEYSDRIKVVEAAGTPEEVFARVRPLIQELFLRQH